MTQIRKANPMVGPMVASTFLFEEGISIPARSASKWFLHVQNLEVLNHSLARRACIWVLKGPLANSGFDSRFKRLV